MSGETTTHVLPGRAAAGLLVLALAACAPAPGGAPAPAPAPLAIRDAPAEVHGYRQTDFTRFEMASAGVAYRYGSGPPISPDVYVYPVGETDRAAGDAVAQARAESDNLKSALEMQRGQRRIQGFEVTGDTAVAIPLAGGRVVGWHLAARVHAPRGPAIETHQHLFAVGDQFLKVRTSFPLGTASAGAELDSFVRELLRLMLAPPEASPRTGRSG